MGRPPPAGARVRAAPVQVWLYTILALATVPYVGVVVNRYALTEPGAWFGFGFAVLVGVGLLLRWRFLWVVAFAVDAYLLGVGLWTAVTDPVTGLVMAGRAGLGWGLLLAPATRVHLFGSVEWRDPEPLQDP